jgi:hypothetical protein
MRTRLEAIRGYGRPQRLGLLLIDGVLAAALSLALYRVLIHPGVPVDDFLGVFWIGGVLYAMAWVGVLFLQGAYLPRAHWSTQEEAWAIVRATIWLTIVGSVALLMFVSDAGGGALALVVLFPLQGLLAVSLRLGLRWGTELRPGRNRGALADSYSGPASDRLSPDITPIILICLVGLLVSIMAFYPGWMSPDSLDQYMQARTGNFSDWHPPLMQWWWSLLLPIYDGPALMLIQDLVLYWGAWGLVAAGMRYRIGGFAYLVPLAGFWPGILFPLGQIWKDVLFGCLLLAAWAILLHAQLSSRRPRWSERLLVILFMMLAVGAKTNGIVALPFLIWYWIHVEGWFARRWAVPVVLAGVLSIATMGFSQVPLLGASVLQASAFQYTQQYDLLGISVRTDQVLLPAYVTARAGDEVSELATLYDADSNNRMAFYAGGGTLTYDPAQLEDLASRWQRAVIDHPIEYLSHRWDHFWTMMRIGGGPAYVAIPTIEPNQFGLSFAPNRFSDALASTPTTWPWMFLPWVYALVLIGALGVLLRMRWRPHFVLAIGGSAMAFVVPHFFIVPASDYRYLYYAYLCSVLLVAVAVVQTLHRLRVTESWHRVVRPPGRDQARGDGRPT